MGKVLRADRLGTSPDERKPNFQIAATLERYEFVREPHRAPVSRPPCFPQRFRCKVAKKRRRRAMNYSLGFPDFSRELSVIPQAVAGSGGLLLPLQAPGADSAVRAIHHQPAAEGTFADIPPLVDPRLRAALEKRGIARLYTHQADAFDQIAGRQARRHRHPHRQRQDALLQPAGAQSAAARPRRARHVSLPHQGAGRGSAPRIPDRRGRNGQRDPRLHLRWRYPAGRPPSHPPARQRRAHQSRHAAHRHPAAPHQVGALFRESALHRDR